MLLSGTRRAVSVCRAALRTRHVMSSSASAEAPAAAALLGLHDPSLFRTDALVGASWTHGDASTQRLAVHNPGALRCGACHKSPPKVESHACLRLPEHSHGRVPCQRA